MQRRTTEQWQALFKQHEESGDTSAQFCHDNDLCPKYFAKRKKDLGWKHTDKGKPALIRLKKPEQKVLLAEHTVTLHVGYATLSIPQSQSPDWVAQLLKALT